MASDTLRLSNNRIINNLNDAQYQTQHSIDRLSSGQRSNTISTSVADKIIISSHQIELSAVKISQTNATQALDILRSADQAAAHIQDMLIRMQVLSVSATRDLLSDFERALLDKEFQSLKMEIDRLARDARIGSRKTAQTGITPVMFNDDFSNNTLDPDLLLRGNALVTNNALRLTDAVNGQTGAAIGKTRIDTHGGLTTSFRYFSGNGNGADGFSFFFVDASSFNPATSPLGASGGALGYTGMPSAIFGIGFDEFGNFSNGAGGPGFRPQNVVIRGNANSGYQYVAGADVSALGGVDGGFRDVRIHISEDLIINVEISYDNGETFTNILNNIDYRSATGLNELPPEVLFGFSGSTGGLNNEHSIDNLSVLGNIDVARRMRLGGYQTKVGTGILSPDNVTLPIMDMSVRGLTLQNTSITSRENAGKAFERLQFSQQQLSMGRAITNASASVMENISQLTTELTHNLESAYGHIAYIDVAREITQLNTQLLLIQSGTAILDQNNQLRQFVSQQEIDMITL